MLLRFLNQSRAFARPFPNRIMTVLAATLAVALLLASGASPAPAAPTRAKSAAASFAPAAAKAAASRFNSLGPLIADAKRDQQESPTIPVPPLGLISALSGDAVNIASPTIGGALVQGATLRAYPGVWAGQRPLRYQYEWLRCPNGVASVAGGCELLGVTVPTYVAAAPDEARPDLRVQVTPVLAAGMAPSAVSRAVQVAAPLSESLLDLAPQGQPTISGRPRVGEALEASEGLWRASVPAVAYSFLWSRCPRTGGPCSPIPGATAQTYLPTTLDVGSRLVVEVIAGPGVPWDIRPRPQVVSAWSDQTPLVTAPAGALNAAPTAPTLVSPSASNLTLEAPPVLQVTASDRDSDPLGYQFQLANDFSFTTNVQTSDWLETTSTFAVPPEWIVPGRRYFWRARAADGYGGRSGWSNQREVATKPRALGLRDYAPLWSHGPLTVNQASGNLTVTLPGPSYPTAGGSLDVSLTYNSQETNDVSGLGMGWTLGAGDGFSSPPVKLIDHSRLTATSSTTRSRSSGRTEAPTSTRTPATSTTSRSPRTARSWRRAARRRSRSRS